MIRIQWTQLRWSLQKHLRKRLWRRQSRNRLSKCRIFVTKSKTEWRLDRWRIFFFVKLFSFYCSLLIVLAVGLYHPLVGFTNRKYNLLCFLTTNFLCTEQKALSFNRDRCCHLALCLQLILLHLNNNHLGKPTIEKHNNYPNDMSLLLCVNQILVLQVIFDQ